MSRRDDRERHQGGDTDTTTSLRFISCHAKPAHRWFWRRSAIETQLNLSNRERTAMSANNLITALDQISNQFPFFPIA